MRMTKVWLIAIGVQFVNLMIFGGCQSSHEAPTSCGNGHLEPDEECDDGNSTAGDGCSPNCTIEMCGNGIIDPGEQCDDGNTVDGDGCSPNCQLEYCGNGVQDPEEECDGTDFGPNGNPGGLTCTSDCHFPRCGNGRLEPGEQCDDGNTTDADGCEHDCTLPECGNGIVDPGEQCDDGNQVSTDGCDNYCQLDYQVAAPNANIHITTADNDLYVVAAATSLTYQYQLAHIQSGGNEIVDVGIAIMPSTYEEPYKEPAVLNGTASPLYDNYIVRIPPGSYSIFMIGINWGGPWGFSVDINNISFSDSWFNYTDDPTLGVVWAPAEVSMTVSPATAQ